MPATAGLASTVALVVGFPERCRTSSVRSPHDSSRRATVQLDTGKHASGGETSAGEGQRERGLIRSIDPRSTNAGETPEFQCERGF